MGELTVDRLRALATVIIFLVVMLAVFRVAEYPAARYPGPIYKAIFKQRGPVDIVFMGTSRTRRAILSV